MKKILLICVFLSFSLYIGLNSYYSSHFLDFYPINGDFQTYNPFRRMDNNYLIAKDFNIYLGLGLTKISYYLYSLVKTLGFPDLQASYLAVAIICPIVFLLNLFWLTRLLRLELIWTAIISLFFFTNLLFLPLTESGNSLLVLRAAIPYLVSFIIVKNYSSLSNFKSRFLIGSISGFGLIWSTDYGAPTWGAILLMYLISGQSIKQTLYYLFEFVIISISTFIILGFAFAGKYFFSYLEYVDNIKQNQLWYFLTGWYTDDKIFELSDIPNKSLIFVSCAFIMGICYFLRKDALSERFNINKSQLAGLLTILVSLLGGGFLPQLFGHISFHYFLPLLCFLQVIVFKIVHLFCNRKHNFGASLHFTNTCLIIIVVYFLVNLHLRYTMNWKTNFIKDNFYYEESLGTNLHKSYQESIRLAKKLTNNTKELKSNQKLFSTYSSLIDMTIGSFNSSNSDYIIHALGKNESEKYIDDFKSAQPKYVSIVREKEILWGKWNKRVNVDFFKEVFKSYEPYALTWHSIIYTKRSSKLIPIGEKIPFQARRLSNHEIVIYIPTKELVNKYGAIYGLANIDYTVKRKKSYVPIIGKRTYTQVDEVSQFSKKTKTSLAVKYGLAENSKEIFFELLPDSNYLILKFTSFPKNNSTIELKQFDPYIYFYPQKEIDKIKIENIHLK